jgi:bifunctional non-homologous end joining protein LigD
VPDSHGPASEGRSFVIQEHRARRLHYDFRLEHDGVLVSWALPRGVPTDATKNHLAVQTEDHPLEYGAFKGTIPAGEYGAGAVTIWDAGSYDLEKWREGEEVIVTLHGRAKGGLGGSRRFALIHTGGDARAEDNWLIHLMKPTASAAAARSTVLPPDPGPVRTRPPAAIRPEVSDSAAPGWVAPMLVTSGSAGDIADPQDWAFEMKWDGIRAIGTVDHGRATFTSRNRLDLTATYPELAELSAALTAASAVVDGEIVALDPRGRPDFGLLQTRMNLTGPAEIERTATSVPVHFLLFDLMAVDGRSLIHRDYDDRRAQLARIFRETPNGRIQFPPAFSGDLSGAIETSRELGLEGIVAKNRASVYRAGQRGGSWIKIKHHRTQEVVVGGWTAGRGRRTDGLGALLLGIPDGAAMRYIGRVGTGFTDRQLHDIHTTLTPLHRDTPSLEGLTDAEARGVHWVDPTLVGEVEFAEWTPTRRLRQASWRGWRPDKSPREVRPE